MRHFESTGTGGTATPDTPPPPPPNITQTVCYEGEVTCFGGCCADANGTGLCRLLFPEDGNAGYCRPNFEPGEQDCSYTQ